MLEFRLLGPLEVARDGHAADLGGARQRALLAMLLVHANQVVPSDRMLSELWGEAVPGTLQVTVSRVRKALAGVAAEDRLIHRSGGYRLRVEADEVDAHRFERMLEDGRHALAAGDAERAVAIQLEAAGLWRGDPLVDCAYEAFAQPEIARLEGLRLASVEERMEACLALGHAGELVAELEALVAEHPLHERLCGQLMLALYRSHRQTEALAVYAEARRTMNDALGLEPGPALRGLQLSILRQGDELQRPGARRTDARRPGDRPIATRVAARAHHGDRSGDAARVPLPPTPTVGREHDVERLRGLLADPGARLVTLVGPAGVGKTRVALDAGRTQPEPARFVSLAPLATADHVGATIARALGLPVAPGTTPEDAIVRQLSRQRMLLILDNFEHVLDAAPFVAALVAAAAQVTVLVTSREPLRVRAERRCELHPLALDPAVELFLQLTAARGSGSWEQQPDDVAALCRRLDGLPLAIELAAGRVGLLSPTDVAQRLEAGIDVLGPGASDAPARHQTLRASLDWSYRMLEPLERRALEDLSVFAGGAGLEAAQDVTGASLGVLAALVDKHLVLRERRADGTVRLGMLETIRSFARERLAARGDEDVARRHARHFLVIAEPVAEDLRRAGALELANPVAVDVDNVRVALRWALDAPDPELALRLAAAFDEYLFLTQPLEGEGWVEASLQLAGEGVEPHRRARALHRRAIHLVNRSHWQGAAAAAEAGFALSGDATGRALARIDLAYSRYGEQRRDEAAALFEEAAEHAREAGDEPALAEALLGLAMNATTLAATIEAADAAAHLFARVGNMLQLCFVSLTVGTAALLDGDFAVAGPALREARRRALDAGPEGAVKLPYVRGSEGLLALFTGDHAGAAEAFRDELVGARHFGLDRMVFEGLMGIAGLLAATGEPAPAARVHGAAGAVLATRLDGAERLEAPLAARFDALLAGTADHPDEYAAGRRLGYDAAIELAVAAADELIAGSDSDSPTARA